jgi:hypothetical protein
MLKTIFGILIILHGFVHLLYFGHSARYFELQPGLTWPDGAWLLSRIFNQSVLRNIAGISMIISAFTQIVGGASFLFRQEWARVLIIIGAVISSLAFFLCWNGRFQGMADQGWFGILINVGIIVALSVFQWI